MTRWKPAALVALVALAGAACAPSQPAAAQSADASAEPAKLFLSATGEVAAAPDIAHINAGVVAEAATAAEAMADQAERMTAVMTALADAGIAPADVQTTNLSLSPVYPPYDSNRPNQPQRITGYRASNTVSITARDLDQVGPTLDALVTAGANDISNIAFDVSNAEELRDEARRAAVATLRARASLYGDAAGVRVGRILEMSEVGGYSPAPMMARAAAFDGSTPIAGGELTISITVNATFEIGG